MKNAITKLNNTELNGRKINMYEDSKSARDRKRRSVTHHSPALALGPTLDEPNGHWTQYTNSDRLTGAEVTSESCFPEVVTCYPTEVE